MFRSIVTVLIVAGLFVSLTASAPATNAQIVAEPAAPGAASPQPEAYVGPLTGPQSGDPVELALNYVREHAAELGLTAGDTAEIVVSDTYTDQHNGVTHVYLAQQYQGIGVYNGQINVSVMRDRSILYVGNRFAPNLAKNVNTTQPTLTARQAVEAAADHLELALSKPLQVEETIGGADRAVVFSDGGISQEAIPVRLVYVPQADGTVRLAWNVNIYQLDSLHWWDMQVDATSGKTLSQSDWVVNENFDQHIAGAAELDRGADNRPSDRSSATPARAQANAPAAPDQYRVYPWPVESPIHTTPLPPSDGRTLVVNPADATASPYGWHDTNGVSGAEFITTTGNNAFAYTDTNADNLPDAGSSPSGGVTLNFDFPITLTQAPNTYQPAAVTNLFYWNNLMHDVQQLYGFTPVAGNFQVNNYGSGGLGNDAVNAEAQDGVGTNNANFATPADGSRPRMQMFIWTAPTPDLDGDLDNGIIAHEYGHGISNRLTGGPSNVSCLQNTEQMGEGWSDWYSLFMTLKTGESGAVGRGIGTYALNQPTTGVGIRPARYSTDFGVNNYTYSNLPSMAVPHGVGFVWNTMLWEMNWALIDKYGFNPNIYGAWNTGGNNLANQLIMDGMKLQPCSPGFVDGRNAILAADQALTGGANQCLIWKAFAKRGLGYSASQGSSSSASDGTAAFDLPNACQTVGVVPIEQNICRGQNALYTVSVGEAYVPPVTMSATGNPPPTTVSFTPNPVTVVPTTTLLTVSNTASAATGSYTLTITGTTALTTTNTTAVLRLFDLPGGTPALTAPANSAVDVALRPTFSWAAQPDATSYLLEVATSPAFATIVYSATVNGTSHTASANLQPQTQYYWRARSMNVCGSGSPAAAFTFRTALVVCAMPNAAIPDNVTISSTLNVATSGTLLDLNVSVSGTHTWVGDLVFTLTHPSGVQASFINRPGVPTSTFGCGNDNFDPAVDDEGVDGPVENQCRTSPTALYGNPTPNSPLSVFDGLSFNGTWTLEVRDFVTQDTGALQQWCLSPALVPVEPAIALAKTVGTDPAACASGNTINVPYGSDVYYCYEATNTGSVTATLHTLTDDHLGVILNNFPYALAPGASAFITQSATLTQTTVNTAEWLAGNGVYSTTATAQATVTVGAPPAISLVKTVGTDPAVCAAGNSLSVPYGSDVTYCYTATNTGGVTLTLHTLTDDQLGTILNNFPYALAPGASAFITQSATLTQTTVNTAEWLAGDGVYSATATAQATVTVGAAPFIRLEKTVGADPAACAVGNSLSVPYGSEVTYCYTATNTGGVTLTLHTLTDDQLGTILNNFPYTLAPGASAFITQSATLTQTTVNTAQWLAGNGVYTVTAAAQATVTVSAPPSIDVPPAPLLSKQYITVQATQTLTVSNTGGADLSWSVTEHDGPSCASPIGLTWASVTPLNGTLAPAGQVPLQVTFDSTGLTAGITYTGTLCLTSNDPSAPEVVVPLTLEVLQHKLYLPLIIY
jgi:extracellular elastinolytic metalloproteinase